MPGIGSADVTNLLRSGYRFRTRSTLETPPGIGASPNVNWTAGSSIPASRNACRTRATTSASGSFRLAANEVSSATRIARRSLGARPSPDTEPKQVAVRRELTVAIEHAGREVEDG